MFLHSLRDAQGLRYLLESLPATTFPRVALGLTPSFCQISHQNAHFQEDLPVTLHKPPSCHTLAPVTLFFFN